MWLPDDFAVDGAGDAVLELEVHFWDSVFREDGGVGNVTFPIRGEVVSLLSRESEDFGG